MSDNIHVAVRVRPLISRELREKGADYWKVEKGNTIFQVDKNDRQASSAYIFDRVFNSSQSTYDVYREMAKPIAESVIKGFNGTILAYGQTSSGKTYTMMGDKESPGIIGLTIDELFEIIENSPDRMFLLRVSYMEIYSESVIDLLCNSKTCLKVHENTNGEFFVADLKEQTVNSPEQIFEVMKIGEKARRFGVTNLNERSSRSHTIFTMTIESRKREFSDEAVTVSQLNLVDLAGSERANQAGTKGERFKEGCSINLSLLTFGRVINGLSEGHQFIRFRDSILTKILKSSLGGNARTVIICAITPAELEQTHSTLKFASNAKKIKNQPHINEVLSDEAQMKKYNKKIAELTKLLESSTGAMQYKDKQLEEKERHNEELEHQIKVWKEKLVVSSLAMPLQDKTNVSFRQKKLRRETWCASSMGGLKRRKSLAFLLAHDLNNAQDVSSSSLKLDIDPIGDTESGSSNRSSSDGLDDSLSVSFHDMPQETFERDLRLSEKMNLIEMSPMPTSIQKAASKSKSQKVHWGETTAKSPEESWSNQKEKIVNLETNLEVMQRKLDNSNKQISELMELTGKLKGENKHLEKEFKELQEFTHLEAEIYQEQRISVDDPDQQIKILWARVKFLEKSEKDMEKLYMENLNLLNEIHTDESNSNVLTLDQAKQDFDTYIEYEVAKNKTRDKELCDQLEDAYREINRLKNQRNSDARNKRNSEVAVSLEELKSKNEILETINKDLEEKLISENEKFKLHLNDLTQSAKEDIGKLTGELNQLKELESKMDRVVLENQRLIENRYATKNELERNVERKNEAVKAKLEIEEKLTIFESTIDSLKKEISEKNDEFVTVVEKNSELEAKVVSLVVELSDAINFKDGLAEKCDGLRVELNGITEQGNEASKLNSELEMKIASAESEKFKIGETRDNLAQACDQLSLELATVIEYRNEAVAANAQLEAKVLSLESEQGEDGLVATCEQLRAELSSVTDLKNKAVESVSETEAKILSLESEKDEITNSRSQLADSHERLRAELIAVTEQKNEAVELNSELEAKIVLLESEKLVVKDQLERTCEELRAEVNAVTEQKHQAVKSSSELEAKVSFLESELCNVRDPKDPLCENDDGPSNRSSSQLEAKVLELESANADLVAKMTDLKETDKTENDQQSKQRQELTNIREELINANMLMETLEDRYNVLIQEKNVISDARDDLQSRYLQLETERNDILQASTAKLDELQNENENLVQKCTELMSVEAEFCEKNRSMDELKSRLGTVLEENENITKLCEELRLEVSSLENLEKEFESKIREINDLRSKIEDIEIENRQLVEKCDELTNVKSESRFEDKMDETKPDVTLDFDDNERSNVDDDVLDNTAYLEKCREVNKFESKLKLLQAEKKETITRCKELQTKIDNLLPKMNAMAEKCEEIDGLREKVRLLDSNDRDNSEYDGGQVSESRPVDQNYMFVDGETMKKMKNMQLESIEELANELINTKKQISAERDDNYSKQQVLHARVSEVENLLKVNDDGIQKLLTSSPFATPVPKKRKSDVLEDDKTTFRSGDGEIIRVKEENDDHEISLQIPEFIFEKETSKVETREIEIQVGNGDELFTKQEYDNLRIENEELIVKLAEVDKTVAENEDNIKLVETLESEIRDYKTQIRDLRLEMENVRLLYESGTKTESEAQCDIISAREYAELLETKINLEDQVRNIRQEIEKYLESNESLIIDLKTKQSELDDSRRSIVEIEEILRNERADREQQRSCMLDDIKKLNEENVCLKSDVDKVEMKKERLMEETKRHIADVRSELTKEKETALAVQQSRMEKEVIENLPLIRQQITEKLDEEYEKKIEAVKDEMKLTKEKYNLRSKELESDRDEKSKYLNGKIKDIEFQLDEKNKLIVQIEERHDGTEVELSASRQKIVELKEKLESATRKLTEFEDKVKDVEDEYERNLSRLESNMKKESNDRENQFAAQSRKLEKELCERNAQEIVALEEAITSANDVKMEERLNKARKAFTDEKIALENKMVSEKKEMSDKLTEKMDLANRLERRLGDIESKTGNLETTLADREKSIEDLRCELISKQNDLKDSTADVKDLKREVNDLAKTNDSISREILLRTDELEQARNLLAGKTAEKEVVCGLRRELTSKEECIEDLNWELSKVQESEQVLMQNVDKLNEELSNQKEEFEKLVEVGKKRKLEMIGNIKEDKLVKDVENIEAKLRSILVKCDIWDEVKDLMKEESEFSIKFVNMYEMLDIIAEYYDDQINELQRCNSNISAEKDKLSKDLDEFIMKGSDSKLLDDAEDKIEFWRNKFAALERSTCDKKVVQQQSRNESTSENRDKLQMKDLEKLSEKLRSILVKQGIWDEVKRLMKDETTCVERLTNMFEMSDIVEEYYDDKIADLKSIVSNVSEEMAKSKKDLDEFLLKGSDSKLLDDAEAQIELWKSKYVDLKSSSKAATATCSTSVLNEQIKDLSLKNNKLHNNLKKMEESVRQERLNLANVKEKGRETERKMTELKDVYEKANDEIVSMRIKFVNLNRKVMNDELPYKNQVRNLEEELDFNRKKIGELKLQLRRTQDELNTTVLGNERKEENADSQRSYGVPITGIGSGIVQSCMIDVYKNKIYKLETELEKYKSHSLNMTGQSKSVLADTVNVSSDRSHKLRSQKRKSARPSTPKSKTLKVRLDSPRPPLDTPRPPLDTPRPKSSRKILNMDDGDSLKFNYDIPENSERYSLRGRIREETSKSEESETCKVQ